MSKTYCTVAVETIDLFEVIGLLESFLSIHSPAAISEPTLGFHFHVYKAPDEWLHGRNSLEVPLLEEEDFYKVFNVSAFACFVDLYCGSASSMKVCINAVADSVGRIISENLHRRTLVFFDGTNVPFCLYENGARASVFSQYIQGYFEDKDWIPSMIGS